KLDTLPTPWFVPGEIIVKYQTGRQGMRLQAATPRARVGQFLADRLEGLPVSRRPLLKALHPDRFRGARRETLLARRDRRERFGLRGVDVYEVPPAADLRALCRWLTRLEEVEQAHPNYTFPLQFVPDDPFYSSSGSWGQGFDDLYGPKLLQCASAWDLSQGAGVVVAVVDSGVDYTHPDLTANMWINALEDINGNGTYEPWPDTEQREGVFGDHDSIDND
ncbi:unnamed protein product, partial [marine sediment metagenome]